MGMDRGGSVDFSQIADEELVEKVVGDKPSPRFDSSPRFVKARGVCEQKQQSHSYRSISNKSIKVVEGLTFWPNQI
jgi:hypothetical protein